MMRPIPTEDLRNPDHSALATIDILQELQERLDAGRIAPTRITINLPTGLPVNILVEVTDPSDMRAWAEYDAAAIWASHDHIITVLDNITWFCVLTLTTPTTQEH